MEEEREGQAEEQATVNEETKTEEGSQVLNPELVGF